VRSDVLYTRSVTGEDGRQIVQTANGYFNTRPVYVVEGEPFDLTDVCTELNGKNENFTARGSGYSIDAITDVCIVVSQYMPLSGSSYFPTPTWLRKKKCVLNIENDDNLCFAYSILTLFHPGKKQMSC
jgi:hypothetical protein